MRWQSKKGACSYDEQSSYASSLYSSTSRLKIYDKVRLNPWPFRAREFTYADAARLDLLNGFRVQLATPVSQESQEADESKTGTQLAGLGSLGFSNFTVNRN